MSEINPYPSTSNLCGPFVEPEVRDNGRAFSAPIKPGCAAPEVTVDGGAEIVYINGEPEALETEL